MEAGAKNTLSIIAIVIVLLLLGVEIYRDVLHMGLLEHKTTYPNGVLPPEVFGTQQ